MSPARVVLVAGVAAAVALAAVGVIAAVRPGTSASMADRVDGVAAELRCPDCQGLSVADSPSDAAAEIRRQIGELLAEGRTPAEVKQHFVDRYGEWILLAPRSPLVWIAPLIVTSAALVVLGVWLARREATGRRSRGGLEPDVRHVRPGYRERVREDVEALDA